MSNEAFTQPRSKISLRWGTEKCAFVAAGAVDTGAILTSDLEWPPDRVEVSPGPRVNTLFRDRKAREK